MSLVFGLLSLVCAGFFLGIPAIVLGFVARKNIERSGGATTGLGMATGGIVTGFVGTLVSSVLTIVTLVLAIAGARSAPPHIGKGTSHRASVGAVSVVQLASAEGPLADQLRAELLRARSAKKVLVVQTTASWCGACDEIESSLRDARMQTALSGVHLVRVDVDEFKSELARQSMWEESVPWFYTIDAAARPTDAISADEWDDNVPENMAPVLQKFANGTLKVRRHGSEIGTPL
jgi:thiol:disulfide interchange protein